ncbi:hypothetical protein [Lysinibacillus sp. 54212]|uniref:hypothetical protein n=1 Tax=Lysinibacillus sp. 54212 TaxID=3119829 RepID=UPI002FCC4BB4
MKKFMLMIMASLLLVGCQDSPKEKETEVEPYVDNRTVYESNSKPRGIRLDLGENNIDTTPSFVGLLGHCWNEDINQCFSELNYSPEEKIKTYQKSQLPPNTSIKIIFDYDPAKEKTLPYPNTLELYLVKDDQYAPVPITDNSFIIPSENGTYTYVVKSIYDDEFKGIAFHGFQIMVRE